MLNKFNLGDSVDIVTTQVSAIYQCKVSAVNVKDNPGAQDGTNKEPGKKYTYDVVVIVEDNNEVETGEQIIFRDIDERVLMESGN